MQELRPGLWTWSAPHPEWKPEDGGPEGWDREVRSYAYESGDCLVLFDPIAPPTLVDELMRAEDVAVLLTVYWHARSTRECVERLGAHVWAPEAGVGKANERIDVAVEPFSFGDTLPGGVAAQAAHRADEALFWIPAHRALVAGDVLLGGELGFHFQPDSWIEGATPQEARASLRPLLELPVELVLLTHGDPVLEDAREALAGVLET